MKANQFEVDMEHEGQDGLLMTCCMDHIYNCTDDVKLGDVITCEDCGMEMVLTEYDGGIMKWRAR